MYDSLLIGAVNIKLSTTLTPLWLLGVGALAGLAVLLVLWLLATAISRLPVIGGLADRMGRATDGGALSGVLGVILRPLLVLVSRRTVAEIPSVVREGVLWPLFVITVSLAAFGVVGAVIPQDPMGLLASLKRLPFVGTQSLSFSVPVSEPENPDDEFSDLTTTEIPVALRSEEVREIAFQSDQRLEVATKPFHEVQPGASIDVLAGDRHAWYRGVRKTDLFLQDESIGKLYVRNLGSDAAALDLTIVTTPRYPEVIAIPIMAVSVVVVFLLYLLQQASAPRLSAIALSTYKSEIAQPLFAIILALGVVLLVLFVWIPYNTLGEDIKMLKSSSLALITVLGVVQAIWAAGTSVSEEIDGRTALTVLSKPVGRRSFIAGKFLGIVWTVGLLFLVLGLVLLVMVSYKLVYDERESSRVASVTWQLCHMEVVRTVPGLVLAFMEAIVLAAISVAISTRLPLLANLVICATIYALGHLTPLIVQSSVGQLVFVKFFGQLIATVFPVLDYFKVEAAIAGGHAVPPAYLSTALVYCLIYSVIAMLLALVLFEDRDLA